MGTNDTTWKLRLPVGTKARWQAAADAAGMSLSEFVRTTVDWAIEEHPNVSAKVERLERVLYPPKEPLPTPEPHEAGAAGTPAALGYQRLPDQHFKPDFKKGGT